MSKVEKIINDPESIVAEVLEGAVLASQGQAPDGRGGSSAHSLGHRGRQGRAPHRRRLGARADVHLSRRPGLADVSAACLTAFCAAPADE
jgi:hypothetical protein